MRNLEGQILGNSIRNALQDSFWCLIGKLAKNSLLPNSARNPSETGILESICRLLRINPTAITRKIR